MTLDPTSAPNGAFQYIPVPNEHVPAVLAHLGELLTATMVPATSVLATASSQGGDATGRWTDKELARFFAQGTKTSDNVQRMLCHLSDHPGKDAALSTRELAEALSIKYSEMKILPTQVARTLGKHFPGMSAPWSYESRNNEVYFWATAERAEQMSRLAL